MPPAGYLGTDKRNGGPTTLPPNFRVRHIKATIRKHLPKLGITSW